MLAVSLQAIKYTGKGDKEAKKSMTPCQDNCKTHILFCSLRQHNSSHNQTLDETRYPSTALNLISRPASGTTENQGHRWVCCTRCGIPRSPSRTTNEANLDWASVRNTRVNNDPQIWEGEEEGHHCLTLLRIKQVIWYWVYLCLWMSIQAFLLGCPDSQEWRYGSRVTASTPK